MSKCKNQKENGITLLALIITIILMLILATVTVNVVIDGGLFHYVGKAKFVSEVKDIEEQIELAKIKNDGKNLKFSTIKNAIGRDDEYNKMLSIEDGKLVYDSEKVSDKHVKWLEEMKIYEKKEIIPIFTEEQLKKIGTGEEIQIEEAGNDIYVFLKDAHYSLQNNINITEEWNSLGEFSGIFNGNNYTVNNIIFNKQYDGLFGENSGIIKNLTITVNKESSGSNIGAIATYNDNGGYIIGCICKAGETVGGGNAGMAYTNRGYIIGCKNIANVTSGGMYGICALNYGLIMGCCNTGTIEKTTWGLGGLVFTNYPSGIITKCYNIGNLKTTSHTVGGIASENRGTITSCYNMGKISGSMNEGGIIGNSSAGNVNNCYYLDISADSLIGKGSTEVIGEECISKTSSEMQTEDFINLLNETNEEYGIDYNVIWKLGKQYPFLEIIDNSNM